MHFWNNKNKTVPTLDPFQTAMQTCMKTLKEKLSKEDAESNLLLSLFTAIELGLTFENERPAHLEEAKNTIAFIQEKRPDLKEVMEEFNETFQNIIKKPKPPN